MRHRKKSRKFSRSRAQRKALVKSLVRALFTYERITTTQAKAKGAREWADKLIEWAKKDSLHHRRLVYKFLCDHKLVKRLFEDIGPRFKDISGGYTRIFKLGYRKGDGADISLLELTRVRKEGEKKKKKKEEKKEIIVEEKKTPLKKETQPQKKFLRGIKKIFKKEKDSF
ncbi:MAG: 50S ribosomal protein L17 [Candidatus Omnitrophica bacterium 4484_70.2]|nr:MAG: 50S ribosomal protein L17 [Candidatus Omnitrophica bacterium 4484_70.2]